MREEALEARVIADRRHAQLANFAAALAAALRRDRERRCAAAAWTSWVRRAEAARRAKALFRRAAAHYDAKVVVRTQLRRWRNW